MFQSSISQWVCLKVFERIIFVSSHVHCVMFHTPVIYPLIGSWFSVFKEKKMPSNSSKCPQEDWDFLYQGLCPSVSNEWKICGVKRAMWPWEPRLREFSLTVNMFWPFFYLNIFCSSWKIWAWKKYNWENWTEVIGHSIPKERGRNVMRSSSLPHFITCHTTRSTSLETIGKQPRHTWN